jgi:hypothetical protein
MKNKRRTLRRVCQASTPPLPLCNSVRNHVVACFLPWHQTYRTSLPRCLKEASLVPRYYFNTRLPERVIHDSVGEELPGPDQACEFARLFALGLLEERDEHPEFLQASIEVTAEDGRVIFDLPLADAAMIAPEPASTKH